MVFRLLHSKAGTDDGVEGGVGVVEAVGAGGVEGAIEVARGQDVGGRDTAVDAPRVSLQGGCSKTKAFPA